MQFGARQRNTFILVAIALAIFAACIQHQRWLYKDWHQGSGKYIQRIHLPDKKVLEIAALGYDNLYADFLTLRAIQMFGAAWETETREIKPIYDYFDIVTSLDPHFIDVYELSHLVISDDHRAHDEALELLRKGISENKKAAEDAEAEGRTFHRDWRLPYLGLYTAIWDQKNPEIAHEFLRYLQEVPDAPEHILRMEEYIERQSGKFHAAFDINLKNFINYHRLDMEVERNLALEKFRVILDGWYRLELARAADNYYQKTGGHPMSIEELLEKEEFIPRFEAPTLQTLADAIDEYASLGGSLEQHRDQIRDRSMTTIVGLPPEPNGTWYYIDTGMRREAIEEQEHQRMIAEERTRERAEAEERGEELPAAKPARELMLTEKYPYILPASDLYTGLDMIAMETQRTIMGTQATSGEYPTHEEISRYLGADNFGGHFVYIRENTFDGFPRFFSTTQIRRLLRKEPRLGLRGTLDNFPRRTYRITEDMPPYLTTVPSIWDNAEDAEWAICMGLEPGVPMERQSNEVIAGLRNAEKYRACDGHISLPAELEE